MHAIIFEEKLTRETTTDEAHTLCRSKAAINSH